MGELWKYVLAFIVGMVPLAGLFYFILCYWLSIDLRRVTLPFLGFSVVIGACYWSLYYLQRIRSYRRRLLYMMYVLFLTATVPAGALLWWSHRGTSVPAFTTFAVIAVTVLGAAGILWLAYLTLKKLKVGARPTDVDRE